MSSESDSEEEKELDYVQSSREVKALESRPPSPQAPAEVESLKEIKEGRRYPPMAPITTTVVNYGPNRSIETTCETKPYGPDQARAVRKTLGPLNKETALDWLSKLSRMTAISREDTTAVLRECMTREEYNALPGEVQLANTKDTGEIYEAVFKLCYLHENLIGKYYLDNQR
ncbi:unnamed protein product [Caretta caretta]